MRVRLGGVAVALAIGLAGCGGKLVRLAKDGQWEQVDREARAMKRVPKGKAARAWAEALVELGQVDEARAVLMHDWRTGGREPSLLALAALEGSIGANGMAAAHFARLFAVDDQDLRDSDSAKLACDLFRTRAGALARLGEALAADGDLRRLRSLCPTSITDADRALLSAIEPRAAEQARAQRTLESTTLEGESASAGEQRLAERLELARKRSPRAVVALADAERMQLGPEDVAGLLGAEFAGGLGPGLVSPQRLSGWVGDNDVGVVVDAIEGLPDGIREYALLRLAGVRHSDRLAGERETWIVAAMSATEGQGPREAAMAWRVAASGGDLAGAEFALNTNLRALTVEQAVGAPTQPWWLRVPVDRQTFDLLLSLARLFELRDKPDDALVLRRNVIAAGSELGLSQVEQVASEEIHRQLVLGHPWQALAIAEVVPGAATWSISAAEALGGDAQFDRSMIDRMLGEAWVGRPGPQSNTAKSRDAASCPSVATWFESGSTRHGEVGLAPAAGTALQAALTDGLAPISTREALVRALESDVALTCSGPIVIPLLAGGLHAVSLATLDERLAQAPELEGAGQKQLHAELALGHGKFDRAVLLTNAAAAISADPIEIWGRAAVAGRENGAREYTIEALRQVLMHSPGMRNAAARRELLLIRLRDVDIDAILRDPETEPENSTRETALGELRRATADWLLEAPPALRWRMLDDLLWQLASEPRIDALAWSLLDEALLDPDTRDRHPAAVQAIDRASALGDTSAGDKLASDRQLAFLSDSAALCQLAESAGDPPTLDSLIGVATACPARQRARAIAAIYAGAKADERGRLREFLLADWSAVELDPGGGSLTSVPGLPREGLRLRILFGLPLESMWIVDPRSERG